MLTPWKKIRRCRSCRCRFWYCSCSKDARSFLYDGIYYRNRKTFVGKTLLYGYFKKCLSGTCHHGFQKVCNRTCGSLKITRRGKIFNNLSSLLFLYHIAKLTLFIIPMEEPYVPLFQHAASVHLPLLSDFCPQTAPYLLLQYRK